MVSSAHLKLLVFLLAILIPSCASPSLAFCMMYSAYKLSKQGDIIQFSSVQSLSSIWLFATPWTTARQASLSVTNSWESLDIILFWFGTNLLFHVQFQLLLLDLHTDIFGGRSGGLAFPSLSEFSLVVIYTIKSFGIFNKAEVDAFLELSCFFDDPADVGNLMSGPSTFSKSSLNI